jgi:hypothetical protein
MTTTSTRKRYLVNVVEWGSYVRWIEADSAEAAIELAEHEFYEHGDADFKRKDGSVDCEVWEMQDITAEP